MTRELQRFADWTPELWELWTIDKFRAQRNYLGYGRQGWPLAPDWLQYFRELYGADVVYIIQSYNGFDEAQQLRPNPPDAVPVEATCRCCNSYCYNIDATLEELNYEYFRRLF